MAIGDEITAENIISLRAKLKMTHEEFGALLSVNKSTCRKWATQGTKPNPIQRRLLKKLMEENGIVSKSDSPAVRMVTPSNLKTLEQYAASMVMALISLKTLAGFGLAGVNTGFLSQDEEETAKTIAWELRRLMELYNRHLSEILERTEMTKEEIMASVSSLEPITNKRV